jgi:hypothetical protein
MAVTGFDAAFFRNGFDEGGPARELGGFGSLPVRCSGKNKTEIVFCDGCVFSYRWNARSEL